MQLRIVLYTSIIGARFYGALQMAPSDFSNLQRPEFMLLRRSYLAWLSALAAVPVFAGSESDPNFYEEIVVTVTRTEKPINAIPNTVRVVDQEALRAQLALSSSLLDSLSFHVPSMTAGRQKMTSSGVTLRGRTPLYLVDGIPQSTPLRNGERSGFTLDPAFVERIEVIYGANAIQGVGATGGVINTVTRSAPMSGDWLRELGVEISSDDFEGNGYHYKTSALLGKKNGVYDGVVGLALDEKDLFHDGDGEPLAVDPVQGDIMDSRSWNLFTKAGWDLTGDQRLEFSANVFELEGDGDYAVVPGDMANGVPATSKSGSNPGDPPRNEATNLALSYTHDALGGGKLSTQWFYYDFYALYGAGATPIAAFQDASIAPLNTLVDQSALSSEKYGGKLTYVRDNAFWQGFQMVGGFDYLRDETFQELAQTGRLWVPVMEYQGWAPFVQLEQGLMDDKIRLSGGLRYENVTLDVPTFTTIASANNTLVEGGSPSFSEVLRNAGLVYEPAPGFTLFASYAEGFNMPDAGLILRAVNTPDRTVTELVDLQPIVADNVEFGFGYRLEGLDASVSYFQSDSDLGSRIQVIDGAGRIMREKTEIHGVELSARYFFDSGLEIGGNYAHLNGRSDTDGDGRVDADLDGRNISPDRFNLWTQAEWGNITGRLQYSHFQDRTFVGHARHFDGYGLLDLLVSYEHDRYGAFSLGVQNLLAEQYLTYYAQTVSFVNNDSFVAGRGRAFTFAWKGEL
jgi:iron complex outermembrane receptor protein